MRSSRASHTGEIAPGTKGAVTSGTVLFGSEAVTAKLEVVVDPAMGGEEALRMARLGCFSEEQKHALAGSMQPTIRNVAGQPVGEMRATRALGR